MGLGGLGWWFMGSGWWGCFELFLLLFEFGGLALMGCCFKFGVRV